MTGRPWSMTDEVRDGRPRDRRPPGPVMWVLRYALWAGANLYIGWWAVYGTIMAFATLDDVADRTIGFQILAFAAVAVIAALIVVVGLLLNLALRRLLCGMARSRFVLGSVVAFGVPHLYLLAVVAGLPLPWRLPGW